MFGELVRGHRRRLGLTQEELARKAGISARHIRLIEAGRIAQPRLVTLRLLTEAFGLSGLDQDRFRSAALPDADENLAAGQVPGRRVPAQLPADVYGFIGRSHPLARLDAVLGAAGEQPTAVLITAVSGTAGVGKTALAVHWAHRVRQRFPDGQLYINLRGFDPTGMAMDPADAIRRLLDALDVAPERVRTDLDAQAALYRSLLADKRMLIVVDNARDADQVRPLLPGAPGCLVLVTSRSQLTGLVAAEAAHPLALDVLSVVEARELLSRRLGPERAAAEPDAVDEIISSSARLPLALAIVAARAVVEPQLTLAALAAQLRDASGPLDALAIGDTTTDVRAVFAWSYQAVTQDAARLFRLLGLHPGPDVSAAAAASFAGLPPARVRQLMGELVRARLVNEHVPGRYTCHDLLRAYATEQAHISDPDRDRRAAMHRLLDHYLQTAHAAAHLFRPYQETTDPGLPRPGVTPEHCANYQRAMTWLATEHHVLLAAIDRAGRTGYEVQTWQLAWTIRRYLDRRGHWRDLETTQTAALGAARHLARTAWQAHSHRGLAHAYTELRSYDDAHANLRNAMELFVQLHDHNGQARTHFDLSLLSYRQQRYAEQLAHARRACELAGTPDWADALQLIGFAHVGLGDHEQAITVLKRALHLHRELGAPNAEAGTLDGLGYAHHHLGQHAQAVSYLQQALDVFREQGTRPGEIEVLDHLGDAYQAVGSTDAARDAWQEAASILGELNHPDAEIIRDKLRQLGAGSQVHGHPAPNSRTR